MTEVRLRTTERVFCIFMNDRDRREGNVRFLHIKYDAMGENLGIHKVIISI